MTAPAVPEFASIVKCDIRYQKRATLSAKIFVEG